jgi:hypothetical protein
MVMRAAPGGKISGPYRRTYDKNIIQQITVDGGPESILLLLIDPAYASGQPGRFCRGQPPNQKTRDFFF